MSRVLASSGGGNVTLFAFDRGQGLSEHTAPFDALVQARERSAPGSYWRNRGESRTWGNRSDARKRAAFAPRTRALSHAAHHAA